MLHENILVNFGVIFCLRETHEIFFTRAEKKIIDYLYVLKSFRRFPKFATLDKRCLLWENNMTSCYARN